MEDFQKIDWIPNVEDLVDNRFISEERLQNEGAMCKILNGTFLDPFVDIRVNLGPPKKLTHNVFYKPGMRGIPRGRMNKPNKNKNKKKNKVPVKE